MTQDQTPSQPGAAAIAPDEDKGPCGGCGMSFRHHPRDWCPDGQGRYIETNEYEDEDEE